MLGVAAQKHHCSLYVAAVEWGEEQEEMFGRDFARPL